MSRRLVMSLAVLACSIAGASPGRATHLDGDPGSSRFAPTFTAAVDFPTVNQFSDLSLRVQQTDHEDQIDQYEVTIPSGWRFPFASIRESSLAGCKDSQGLAGLPGYIHDHM